jgi:hypothetical protein
MVIVRIAKGWYGLEEDEVKSAIKSAIDQTSKLAVSHGYYSVAKSQTTNSRYLARTRHPPPLEVLRISDHSPTPKAFQNVSIIFPATLKEGSYGKGMFFANAMDDSSIQEAFLKADAEVQRRMEATAPPLVMSWILRSCKFAS